MFSLTLQKEMSTKRLLPYQAISFIFLVTFTFFCLTGCGSEPNSSTGLGSPEIAGSLVTVNKIELSATPDLLKVNSNATIIANVYDTEDKLVPAGVEVSFTSDMPDATINPSSALTDQHGKALVTFTAGSTKGEVKITATSGSVTKELTIQIIETPAASIEFLSEPDPDKRVLGVKGSGLPETLEVSFLVKDDQGDPVADGTEVVFSLLGVSGDEYISDTRDFTQGGLVSTFLNSGKVSGTVSIVASTEVGGFLLETASREFVIHAGLPDAEHFSIAADIFNIAGLIWDGKSAEISVRLADQYGNPVPDGTIVYFAAEGGSVTPKSWTDPTGLATATLISQNPRPEDGMVTVMAYTVGQESYTDKNSNGVYDEGDDFSLVYQDLSEPYLDEDMNYIHDEDERFWDESSVFAKQNEWDAGNGQWDKKLFIWGDIEIVFSGYSQIWIFDEKPDISEWGRGNIPQAPIPLMSTIYPDMADPDIEIPNGGSKDFYIVAADIKGNGLTEGTGINTQLSELTLDPNSTPSVVIMGDTSYTIKSSRPDIAKKLFKVTVYDTDPASRPFTLYLEVAVTSTDSLDNELSMPIKIQ